MRYSIKDYLPFASELGLFGLSSTVLGMNITNLLRNFDDSSWISNRDMVITGAQMFATAHCINLLLSRYFKNYPSKLKKDDLERLTERQDSIHQFISSAKEALHEVSLLNQYSNHQLDTCEAQMRADQEYIDSVENNFTRTSPSRPTGV